MKSRTTGAVLLVGLLAAAFAARAVAQNQTMPALATGDGISVYGTGEVAIRPNWVEFDLNVSGKAELTGDAQVKYRDAKKRLVAALEKLDMKDLTVEQLGVSLSAGNSIAQNQRIINGVPQNAGKTEIEVSSTMRVCLKNVRDVPSDELVQTVGRLIDVAQDAGVRVGLSPAEIQMRQRYGIYFGQNSTVRFVVADLRELREKAYEAAVTDARKRAARLAKLNHVKLGPAVLVQEIKVAGDAPEKAKSANPYLPYIISQSLAGSNPEASDEPRISSPTLTDIPVQVKLLVRFSIEPADPATAQK